MFNSWLTEHCPKPKNCYIKKIEKVTTKKRICLISAWYKACHEKSAKCYEDLEVEEVTSFWGALAELTERGNIWIKSWQMS